MLLLGSLVAGPPVAQASETGSFLYSRQHDALCRVHCMLSSVVRAVQASYSFYTLDEEIELPVCETACPRAGCRAVIRAPAEARALSPSLNTSWSGHMKEGQQRRAKPLPGANGELLF